MKVSKLILFISLWVITFSSFSQKHFVEGYIITFENDTLHGKVRDRFRFQPHIQPSFIKFIGNSGKAKKFKPKDIKGYSKNDIINYVSIKSGYFNYKFARIKLDGIIKLLALQSETSNIQHFIHSNNFNDHSPYSEGRLITKAYLYNSLTGETTKIKQMNYRKQLSEYFSDHERLKNLILEKQLGLSDIEVIVKEYNKWKETQRNFDLLNK